MYLNVFPFGKKITYKQSFCTSLASVCIGLMSLLSSASSLADEGESHWYLGGQMGWGLYGDACAEQALDCNDNAAAFGLFGGYQLSPHWQIEVSYLNPGDMTTHYPRLTSTPLKVMGDMDIADLSLQYNLPLSAQWQLQLRGGAAYWEAESQSREFAFEADGVSPSVGVALEWAMNESWAGRLGYQYLHDLGDDNTGGASLNLLSVGMRYRFGATASSTKAVAAPVVASPLAQATPVPLQLRVFFELNRDYTNQLGQLAPVVDRLKQNPQARVELIGFADSQGDSAYNRQLSLRRANFVAGYLQSHGISAARMLVRGQGESELHTGHTGLERAADDDVSRRVLVQIVEGTRATEVQP